jgi:hypothetical protein
MLYGPSCNQVKIKAAQLFGLDFIRKFPAKIKISGTSRFLYEKLPLGKSEDKVIKAKLCFQTKLIKKIPGN